MAEGEQRTFGQARRRGQATAIDIRAARVLDVEATALRRDPQVRPRQKLVRKTQVVPTMVSEPRPTVSPSASGSTRGKARADTARGPNSKTISRRGRFPPLVT